MSRGKTADRKGKPKDRRTGRGVNFLVRRKCFFTGQEPYMDDPLPSSECGTIKVSLLSPEFSRHLWFPQLPLLLDLIESLKSASENADNPGTVVGTVNPQ